MEARAHVYVGGRVQGVFFRYETQMRARRLGVKGWVRNLSDGRVEAVFEGDREKIEEMLEFCKRGPPGAQVTNLTVKWEEPTGEFSDFEIRYW
ncbi:MAG: acylphosphatase [Hadesarchaea archaeon]|nr:acylphosphatase [Hadesarchaea archaeon]